MRKKTMKKLKILSPKQTAEALSNLNLPDKDLEIDKLINNEIDEMDDEEEDEEDKGDIRGYLPPEDLTSKENKELDI